MAIVSGDREVRILTKNMVDSDSTITVSHGGTTANLYDRDLETEYTTAGAARDTISATISITFNVGSTETQFTFNALMLFNTNVKTIKLESWNSTTSVWVNQFTRVLVNNSLCLTFGAIKTSRVRLTLYDTQTKFNQEKFIG